MSPPSPEENALLIDGRALLTARRLLESGIADRRASFELNFAPSPLVGFITVCGVEHALRKAASASFSSEAIAALMQAKRIDAAFAERASRFRFRLDIDAVPDGTVVFANTPIVTIDGTLFEAALISPFIRSVVQLQSTVATRLARLCLAADGEEVVDGSSADEPTAEASLAVARAAYVGGASSTTNLHANQALGIPYREISFPAGLSDPRTVTPGRTITPAATSADSWTTLPASTFRELGNGDNDEAMLLAGRAAAKAALDSTCTWLVTSAGRAGPALRTRCELVALEDDAGTWRPHPNPAPDFVGGRKFVVRYSDEHEIFRRDVVHLHSERLGSASQFGAAHMAPLAKSMIRNGKWLEAAEPLSVTRDRAIASRRALPTGVQRLDDADVYPVEHSDGLILATASHRDA